MRTFIENYLHFMKNCMRPHYEKLKPLKSGFIKNSNFENNRDRLCFAAFCSMLSTFDDNGWEKKNVPVFKNTGVLNLLLQDYPDITTQQAWTALQRKLWY